MPVDMLYIHVELKWFRIAKMLKWFRISISKLTFLPISVMPPGGDGAFFGSDACCQAEVGHNGHFVRTTVVFAV